MDSKQEISNKSFESQIYLFQFNFVNNKYICNHVAHNMPCQGKHKDFSDRNRYLGVG